MDSQISKRKVRFQADNYKTGWIYWDTHLKAWKEYSRKYGNSQDAEEIARRGGFGENELDEFYPDWRSEGYGIIY